MRHETHLRLLFFVLAGRLAFAARVEVDVGAILVGGGVDILVFFILIVLVFFLAEQAARG